MNSVIQAAPPRYGISAPATKSTLRCERRGLDAGIERVVILDDYSVARGGATALALLAARQLRDAGFRVTYICGDRGDDGVLASEGIDLIALGRADLLSAAPLAAAVDGVHNRAAAIAISRWIAAHDTASTVYHVHGWSKILSPSLFDALDPVAERTLVHAHDFFAACPNGAFFDYRRQETCARRPLGPDCLATSCDKRNFLHKTWRSVRGANLFLQLRRRHRFRRIVMLHEKMAAYFIRAGYGPERLVTIRNPAMAFSETRIEAENNRDLFFIGRLDPEKGILEAVSAAAEAGLGLTVIGDGPLRATIENACPHVQVLGWMSAQEIGATISRARGLIMPSRYPEPFGLVAVEAAASGLPILLPESAFLAEEMRNLGFALTFEAGKPEAMRRAMMALDRLPARELRTMSKAAYELAHGLFHRPEEWRDALLVSYVDLLRPQAGVIRAMPSRNGGCS